MDHQPTPDRMDLLPCDPANLQSPTGSPQGVASDPWGKCFQQVDEMGRLANDWDGDGAAAPTPAVIAQATTLLRTLRDQRLPAPARVGAGPNGTVLLEWQNGLHYFEIEVCTPERVEWMATAPSAEASHGDELNAEALEMLTRTLAR